MRFLCHLITHRRIPLPLDTPVVSCVVCCFCAFVVLRVVLGFELPSPSVFGRGLPVPAHVRLRSSYAVYGRIAVYGRPIRCRAPLSVGRGREIRNLVNYNCERAVISAGLIAMHT